MKFKIGDRVQFSAEALKICDPAIEEKEMQGTVLEVYQTKLLVQFDDGKTPQSYPKSFFEPSGPMA